VRHPRFPQIQVPLFSDPSLDPRKGQQCQASIFLVEPIFPGGEVHDVVLGKEVNEGAVIVVQNGELFWPSEDISKKTVPKQQQQQTSLRACFSQKDKKQNC
jgi:hypothetical protein